MTDRTLTVLHLFCGLGGAELGFQAARPRYLDATARFRCVLGVDNDPEACADFAALTGAPVLQADLATLAPDELRAAAGGEGVGRSCVYGIADPRLDCGPRNGVLGVLRWNEPAGTVIGGADVHAGAAAVADPRIPADDDRPDPPPIIVAEDGTWHRPLTPLDLAVLQGLPLRMPDGRPLQLAGRRKAGWLERIGNAVPPPTAQAIAETIGRSLLAVDAGMGFILGGEGVWVSERGEELSA